MLNETTNDNTVEEVENSEIAENNISVKEDTPAVEQKEIKDYLSTSLFEDVKSISSDDLDTQDEDASEVKELSEAYSNTLVDISEHQLINGRVVGMNDRDVC